MKDLQRSRVEKTRLQYARALALERTASLGNSPCFKKKETLVEEIKQLACSHTVSGIKAIRWTVPKLVQP